MSTADPGVTRKQAQDICVHESLVEGAKAAAWAGGISGAVQLRFHTVCRGVYDAQHLCTWLCALCSTLSAVSRAQRSVGCAEEKSRHLSCCV